MKSLTCKYCTNHTHTETGETEKEVMDKMWEHIKKDHKEESDKSMAMPKEDQDKITEESKARITDI